MKLWWCFVFLDYFFVIGVRTETSSCTTPNGEKALCKPLRSCPILQTAYLSEDEIVQKFVEDSLSCTGSLMVCCGTSSNYKEHLNKLNKTIISKEKNSTTESKKDYTIRNHLPTDKTHCGMQHVDDNVLNETQVSIHEFPWLVLIYGDDKTVSKRSVDSEPTSAFDILFSQWTFSSTDRSIGGNIFPAEPEVTYKCTGVLISNTYVLTDGSCSYRSMQVALGQYNVNKNVSCIKTPHGDVCTDPAINVTIAEQVRSPNGNFLLLRLAEGISYTEYVRPICLPLDESTRPKSKDNVTTSGWINNDAREGGTRLVSDVKIKIRHIMIPNNNCGLNSSPENMCCAIAHEPNYICKVDNGGPMMYQYKKKNWYVEGIVHVDDCNHHCIKGYRITAEVVNWILENMKP